MGIELITGMGGTNHVDSEDVGALNAELIGNGNYLLSGCEVTMTDANTCHVAAGELLLQGRHVRIKGAGEDVSIGNGQAGYNQRYLICLVYSKATSGIETVGLQAFAGAKTTGTATDPAVAAGSILGGDTNVVVPLARLELTGLSVGTPAVMLDSVKGLVALGAEIKKLGDSVSQTKTFYLSSPCMTTRGSFKAPVQLNVCGNFCALYINAITTRTISEFTELVDSDGLAKIGEYLPVEFDSEQQRNIRGENKPVGCRLCGGSDPHLWLIKDTNLGDGSEMRFVFTWVR